MRKLELLSPAADKEIAKEAILHGADAVYIGATSHGARKKAANSIEDIREVVGFAHQYRSKVYVTVNTLVYDRELKNVERLCRNLYEAGVDALIVQDMSLLRLDLPPIALHASTQCDIRTPEKALFLQEMGFSQLVLARELTIPEIKAIREAVSVPIECFVHGALCVSYSGRCGASQLLLGRSANRGECSQICRLPFDLSNARGETILRNRHLLSLKDFNTISMLDRLVEAGVDSFKIEGRLKEMDYVKNITAAYSSRLNDIIGNSNGNYARSSCGVIELSFNPNPEKSFNRSFTSYFTGNRRNSDMTSPLTPKSMGEIITDINDIHNGDGISFFNARNEYEGFNVNKVENGRIVGFRNFKLPAGVTLHRTFDRVWKSELAKSTAVRKLPIDVEIDEKGISAKDCRGVKVRVALGEDIVKDTAKNRFDAKKVFDRLGNTVYTIENFTNNLNPDTFIPASSMSLLRRRLIEALDKANEATYKFDKRRPENREFPYISKILDPQDNVANKVAEEFYRSHGVEKILPAYEVSPSDSKTEAGQLVMTTRFCLRRELGCCKKNPINTGLDKRLVEPLHISSGKNTLTLDFDCVNCEMKIYYSKHYPAGE